MAQLVRRSPETERQLRVLLGLESPVDGADPEDVDVPAAHTNGAAREPGPALER